jgi:hypothetical protein
MPSRSSFAWVELLWQPTKIARSTVPYRPISRWL